jgi:polysaccharide export outer membrane protein
MIRMPLIEKDIQAACRTENELAEEIARLYRERDLLKNPTVYVAVKDFQSQPVAVLGAVNSPGKFLLQRRVRLLELVVFHAGGPSAAAGRKVQIVSTVPNALCEDAAGELGKGTEAKADATFTTYNLTDLLAGKESANPYVRQGDIINLPAAKDAYVIGNVARPSAIPIAEPITLGRALAMVGGPLAYTNKDKIRIIRESPGSTTTTEILIDLKDVDKSKGQDFLLQAGTLSRCPSKAAFQPCSGN